MQELPWTPPDIGLPKSFIARVQLAFAAGVADPRECEYREIEVSVPERRSLITRPGAEYLETRHGWVIPVDKGDRYRFAIQWDGLVRPAFGSGNKANLAADVRAAIRRHRQREPGGVSLSDPDIPALLPALLLRLGEDKLAQEVWTALGDSAASVDFTEEWERNLFDRGLRDHMRGDDRLALIRLRELSRRRKTAQVMALLSDQERRARERTNITPSLVERGSIEALIRDLDQVDTQPSGLDNPGSPNLSEDPRVKALVRRGPAAVSALARCLAEDTRLTRSNNGLRFFAALSGTMVPVADAAYVALRGILGDVVIAELEKSISGERGTAAHRRALARAILARVESR